MPGKNKNTKRQKPEATKDTVAGDPVIILLGETGAGKSTFISVAGRFMASQSGPEIGHSLGSCTKCVQEFRVKNPYDTKRHVRLIDTPGFNDSSAKGDDEQLRKIIVWLEMEPQTKIAGILFLYGIDQARLANESTVVSPKVIPTPPGVCIVTTKWTAKTPIQTRHSHESELQANFPSASVVPFHDTLESAWEVIHKVQDSPGDMTQERFREVLEGIFPQFKRRDVSLIGKMKMMFRRMFA